MKPGIILDPYPRTVEMLFGREEYAELKRLGTVHAWEDGRMPADVLEKHLPGAAILVGQTDLPAERLRKAAALRAVVNVEGNFAPNVDYEACFARGIHVLNAGNAFGPAVAELLLGFAVCLARGIVEADRGFRAGQEVYGRHSNTSSFLIRGQTAGLVGFGSLGRRLLPLLEPFGCRLLVHDPWLPDGYLREQGLEPVGLDELLASSRIVFLLAGATRENAAMIGRRELALLEPGTAFILASRASLVDFEALVERLGRGDIRAAIDVFPEEPLPKDHPLRRMDNVVLSAHRGGSLAESYRLMGRMVVDDAGLILRGLPPVRLQQAARETVTRMASRPVAK